MTSKNTFVPGARVWWHVPKHLERGCYTTVTKIFSNGDFLTAATEKKRIKRVAATKGAIFIAGGKTHVCFQPDSAALSKKLEAIYKRQFDKAYGAKRGREGKQNDAGIPGALR